MNSLMWYGYGPRFAYEYKSKWSIGSWPLVHVCGGINPTTLQPRIAKGIIAIGDIAVEGGDRALPQLAQPARQGGTYVAAQLKAMLAGSQVTSFEYHDNARDDRTELGGDADQVTAEANGVSSPGSSGSPFTCSPCWATAIGSPRCST